MNKYLIALLGAALLLTGACSSTKTDDVLTKGAKSGQYIILTDKITQGEEYFGYEDHNIPLRIYLDNGKITKIEAYGYEDTPEFVARVERNLLPKWNGLSVSQALAKQPDAVSGATYSSKAVIKSVIAGLKYAQKKGIK